MRVRTAAVTDVGIQKKVNQDSLLVQTILTNQGRMVFAVLCDGMGGLEKGEVASATLIRCFRHWAMEELPVLCRGRLREEMLFQQWERLLAEQNLKLQQWGRQKGFRLGTTVLVLLLTEVRYYIMNVGDCRAYQLKGEARQLTTDQTFAADAVAKGYLTQAQARVHPHRHMLLQCCGASEHIVPEKISGMVQKDCVYLLCSDGFCHELSTEELYDLLQPDRFTEEVQVTQNIHLLIERCKQRQERDNISVILIKTCGGKKYAGKWFPFGRKV